MADVKFEIIDHLRVLSEGSKGWTKEVNIIRWNDRQPKIDIRDWDESHEKMSKGITLNKEELKVLKELLNKIDVESLEVS